jgi:Lrp/AsnC family leucine-responsive transcriptional regulator
MDKTEREILTALERDARQSFTELSRKVGLSKTPCWQRVRELQKRGVIAGFRAELDAQKLGLWVHAYVQATIDAARNAEFEAAVRKHDSVLQCYSTAGSGDYLLHLLVPGIIDLDQVLRAEIAHLPGVQRTVTTVCLKTIKNRSSLMACLR